MLRLAICDEDVSFLNYLYYSLRKWIISVGMNIDILAFEDGNELLYNVEIYGHFQIVLIEIKQKKTDGLSLATQIEHRCSSTIIMFVSSHNYCHKRVYSVHPFYFFTKPVEYKELAFIMRKALKKLDIENQTFYFCHKNYNYWLPINEIIYFFSDGRRIGIVSTNGIYYFYDKLDIVYSALQNKTSKFLRIHKSYLVNMYHIKAYQPDNVIVKGNEILPISRSKRHYIKNILHNERK